MIEESAWDSKLFGRKMGVVKPSLDTLGKIGENLEKAAADGYKYIVAKLRRPDEAITRALEKNGFYLSDVGVTWAVKTSDYMAGKGSPSTPNRDKVQTATEKDIPLLQSMITSFFVDSRFYSDPFFTKEEADRLHTVWMENSIRGEAADTVLHIPGSGFATLKKCRDGSGEIVLIGIKDAHRGSGLGSALTYESMKWFGLAGAGFVRVKTQLKNTGAMNFYRKQGFGIHEHDMTFAKIL